MSKIECVWLDLFEAARLFVKILLLSVPNRLMKALRETTSTLQTHNIQLTNATLAEHNMHVINQ